MLLVTANLSSPALPEELWVNILCYLSDYDLKRLKRASQMFRHLLRLPILARRLFRIRPTGVSAKTNRRAEHTTLHPLFDLISYLPEVEYEDLGLNEEALQLAVDCSLYSDRRDRMLR